MLFRRPFVVGDNIVPYSRKLRSVLLHRLTVYLYVKSKSCCDDSCVVTRRVVFSLEQLDGILS